MAEGKDLDVEDDEQAEVRRERIHSASNISGLSTGASHRHGDIALDEMDSVDEILADGKQTHFIRFFDFAISLSPHYIMQ